jgi:hypothetical protein
MPKYVSNGCNTLWDIFQKIVPTPFYELFGRWDTSKGKYIITARQCPFTPTDWRGLPIYIIKPIILREYNIGDDDSDVYTVFYATAPSFGYTNNMVMVIDNLHKNIIVDDELWKKYGYRPLNVEMSFLKRDEIQPNDIEGALKRIGQLLYDWYVNNERFLSGVISVISYEDDTMKYPSIGGRLAMLGGEFYIDQIQRRWTYGQSPTSEIQVLRGGVYESSGSYSSPINGLGKRLLAFEEMRPAQDNSIATVMGKNDASVNTASTLPETYTVKSGDTLRSIAQSVYGSQTKWKPIYYANTSKISNPDIIQVGIVLTIPKE